MDLTVSASSTLRGNVRIPANKSHSFRALIMAGLAEGTSHIISPAVSSDWYRGVEALKMFGAKVHQDDDSWIVQGVAGQPRTPDDVIDCGNSGIILRFFMGLAACCDGYTVLSGDHSIRHIRLCQSLVDALNNVGAWAVSTKNDGHAPVVVRGKMTGGKTVIDGLSSQPVSALLIAASLIDNPTELLVERAGEKPWVGLTLDWLARCGVEVENDNFDRYRVPGGARWDGFESRIPLDWSAALYPIVAGVLTPGSEVRIPGMDIRDSQGDKAVIEVLRNMGADITVDGDTIVARHSDLTGCEIDCNDFIDQFMLLAVVGTAAEGQTVLTNAEVCRHKECDRISEMRKALQAMGADVEEREDGLVIRQSRLHGADLDSRADHRMVMTLSVAAMLADSPSTISDIECVAKTFPDFVQQMKALGAEMDARE
ncbi:MAG: 3-phosphoshikimate 1-carboxyvinyltransferase [Phycisphaerae bacterium]